jgi:ribA/ribD-fused uncharacterized protein
MNNQILGFFGEYRFLSNFHEHEGVSIYIDGLAGQKIACNSVEHAFQASKTFNIEQRLGVVNAETPGKAKKEGRKVDLRPDWEEVKNDVMLELLVQKFTNPYYKELLIATGNAYLEETNIWNDVWFGVCNGIGKNYLGKMLMEIREALCR